ncbi:7881_t:CDS:2, partial [Dentiscutata heterogama]
MPKSKHKNAAKERILTQGRDNEGRFSKTIDTESSDLEYSDPELLIYESENNNEKELDNEIEPNEEKAKRLINGDNSFYNLKWDNNVADGRLSYYSGSSKRTQQRKNKELREAAQGSMSLDNFFEPKKKLDVKYEMSDSNTSDLDITNDTVHKYLTKIFDYEKPQSRIELSLEISQQ